jgi:hypothetical protein
MRENDIYEIKTQICQEYTKLEIQATWRNFNMKTFFYYSIFFNNYL